MKLHFVAMQGDQFGKHALKVFEELGYETTCLTEGETSPRDSIALFTFQPCTGNNGGGRYFRTAFHRTLEVAPPWAQTTPFALGVKRTTDVNPGKKGPSWSPSTFKGAALSVAEMLSDWEPGLEGRPVPWANIMADPSITDRTHGGRTDLDDYLPRVQAWLAQVMSTEVGDQSQADLASAMKILNQLQQLGGYFVGDPSQMMQVSPDHILITLDELAACQANGPLLFQLWEEAQAVYAASLRGADDLEWVAMAIEGPLTTHQRHTQRRVANAQAGVLPLFARADLSSIWFMVELQERLGGLGLMQSWLSAIRNVHGMGGVIGEPGGVAPVFADSVLNATGESTPFIVLICPEGYEAEQSHLAQKLEAEGTLVAVVLKNQIDQRLVARGGRIFYGPRGPQVHAIYRREVNAATLSDSPVGMGIIEAALARNVVVEPPLSMIFDTKVPFALAHDPRLQRWFSDEVRSVIPPTALMPMGIDQPFVLADETLTLRRTVGAPFVVKYGGPHIYYGLGGRAVFNTRDGDEGITRGLREVSEGHTWLVQPMDETRYTSRWLSGDALRSAKVAARMLFHYRRSPRSGKFELFAALATNRPHWKAIGAVDAIVHEIRVSS